MQGNNLDQIHSPPLKCKNAKGGEGSLLEDAEMVLE